MSNEAVVTRTAIGESPAKTPPTQRAHANVHQVLHQDVGGVLPWGPREAAWTQLGELGDVTSRGGRQMSISHHEHEILHGASLPMMSDWTIIKKTKCEILPVQV